MNKLHKKRIQKWIDALRSEKYRQTQGNLKNQENSYCCLGVACDVYEKQTKQKLSLKQWESNYLPDKVLKWFGFDKNPLANKNDCSYNDNPPITKSGISAAHANDSKKWSFKKIANAIEKTYLKDE